MTDKIESPVDAAIDSEAPDNPSQAPSKPKRRYKVSRKGMGGRPRVYDPEKMPHLAKRLCLLGATNEEIAKALGVNISTVESWIIEHPEFGGALKAGREEADANVGKSLYQRATGYKRKVTKVLADGSLVHYEEQMPPDATSMIFWLKNRRPDLWRDKKDFEVAKTVEHKVDLATLPSHELQALADTLALAQQEQEGRARTIDVTPSKP